MRHRRCLSLLIGLVLLTWTLPAEAYIGPGAGFAFLSSFLALLLAFLLAFLSLLTWPVRFLIGWRRRRKAFERALTDRIVLLGLDGMDPALTERFLAEGKLPNFAKLRERGCYHRLGTTTPALSPVAWSSVATGTGPGRHNIFDFLRRNPSTMLPELSSSQIRRPTRALSIGRYRIPLARPTLTLLRKSRTFWKILGDHGIFSHILRVPITFPPEKFRGVLLSGMCAPDLRGTQGTFSFYTSEARNEEQPTGGIHISVEVKETADMHHPTVEAWLIGPENMLARTREPLRIPFKVRLMEREDAARIEVQGRTLTLQRGAYSDWVPLMFKAGLIFKVHGICRFYLKQIEPIFQLYVSPIHIDPERPALPISHPFYFAVYLAKLFGRYATLGLAEDTWGLNEGVLDEEAFLEQVRLTHEERERMFFHVLDKTRKGLCMGVFDGMDRIQHMFFRGLGEEDPANRGSASTRYEDVIEKVYTDMDALVGCVLERTASLEDKRTVLFVLSDHGFKSFRRGVNLNVWLHEQGYLTLKNGDGSRTYLQDVDWGRTQAYAFGLAGLYINRKGRERFGVVEPGEASEALKRELMDRLSGLPDLETGETAILEVFDSRTVYQGPYVDDAPDLILGYNEGYRTSWDGAIGKVCGAVFEDNTKAWSGDHCIHPRLVPGVLFCSRRLNVQDPKLIDIAPTVLRLFGLPLPSYMEGTPLIGSNH